MSLAVVQGPFTGGQSASSTTGTATFGSATAAGSLLVVLLNDNGFAFSVSSVTDSVGNTYTAGPAEFSSAGNKLNIYYCKNATANAGTVTVTLSSAGPYIAIAVYEVSGADTASPYDATSTGSGTGTAIASGTLSLASASEIIFAMIVGNSPPITAGTGYTLTNFNVTGDANKYFGAEYHIVSANEAASATQNASAVWNILAASFKAASGGGATRPVKMVGRWGGYAGASGGFAA